MDLRKVAEIAPALDGAVGVDGAAVVRSGAEGDELPVRWGSQSTGRAGASPASDGAVGANGAGVCVVRGDRDRLARRWVFVGMRLEPPAADGAVGVNGARVLAADGDIEKRLIVGDVDPRGVGSPATDLLLDEETAGRGGVGDDFDKVT